MSVCRSRANSMGRMELSRVEMRAASRLHIAPNTLRSSSRSDTRCSCTDTHTVPTVRQQTFYKTWIWQQIWLMIFFYYYWDADNFSIKGFLSFSQTEQLHPRVVTVINIDLPFDNMKPERGRFHGGWFCTSSYTPLDLHQSEGGEKVGVFSADTKSNQSIINWPL